MREGIKKKAAAQKRKEAKQARKSPQWKSNKPKDPGIPSSFPYKEDIINEIEDKRRQALENKERLKQERIAQQQQKNGGAAAGDNGDEEMEVDEEEQQSNGLAALVESAQRAAAEYNGEPVDGDAMVDDEPEDDLEFVDWDLSKLADVADDDDNDNEDGDAVQDNDTTDKSMKAFNRFFKAVVDASDVVLYVLDARDPEGTRSKKVEEAILSSMDKKLILLLNKVDLVPNDVMNKWIGYYKTRFPVIPIKASSGSSIAVANNFNKNLSQSVTASALLTSLKSYANKSNLKRSIVVGVVGFPNVGKSSIINALTAKHGNSSKVCPVGNQPGVTTTLREVKVDNKLKIIDSPGIVFPPAVDAKKRNSKTLKLQQNAKLTLLNALPTKLIKDPTLAIQLLIRRLKKSESSFSTFEKQYDLPQLPELGDIDIEEYTKLVLIHVARKRGRLGKGGVPNLYSAATCILNDWKDGRFVGWTMPPEKPMDDGSSNSTAEKVSGKVDQTTIVQEWSKEFDLDGLFASTGVDINAN